MVKSKTCNVVEGSHYVYDRNMCCLETRITLITLDDLLHEIHKQLRN